METPSIKAILRAAKAAPIAKGMRTPTACYVALLLDHDAGEVGRMLGLTTSSVLALHSMARDKYTDDEGHGIIRRLILEARNGA